MIRSFLRIFLRLNLGIIILFGLVSCSATEKVEPVFLGSEVSFELEHPASYGKEFSATQGLQIEYQDTHREIMAQVEIDSSHLRMVAFGPMGITLFQLLWDGKKLDVRKQPSVETLFPPRYLIADLQLALWPDFPNNPDLSIEDNPKRRVLFSKGKPILLIDYPLGRRGMPEIHIQHVQRKYRLIVKRLDD